MLQERTNGTGNPLYLAVILLRLARYCIVTVILLRDIGWLGWCLNPRLLLICWLGRGLTFWLRLLILSLIPSWLGLLWHVGNLNV